MPQLKVFCKLEFQQKAKFTRAYHRNRRTQKQHTGKKIRDKIPALLKSIVGSSTAASLTVLVINTIFFYQANGVGQSAVDKPISNYLVLKNYHVFLLLYASSRFTTISMVLTFNCYVKNFASSYWNNIKPGKSLALDRK